MQTNPIANAQAVFNESASNTANKQTRNSAVLNSDFNTFLKMLTTQMKNQDPLNPIDSSEYAAQLAAFSSVEQQVVTNDLLENVLSQLGSSRLSDLSGWIGREIRSDAPVHFDGEPVVVDLTRATGVDTSTLEVFDTLGNVVASRILDADQRRLSWDGRGDNGNMLPVGDYLFRVNNFTDGTSVGYTDALTYQEVREVRSENGQVRLILDGGIEVSTESVVGLRG